MSDSPKVAPSPLTTQPAAAASSSPPPPEATPTVKLNDAPTIERMDEESIVIHRPVEKASFAAGDLLSERYRILRFIAAGGMGEVYEAEDLTLGVRLALKTIKPEIARDPIAVERFKREINIARRITHPNVSRIYDVGLHRGTPEATMFLTMELLGGENLKDLIARKQRLSEEEALPLADQIAAGLAAAHETGIIHRDFKSANVMLVTVLTTGSGLPRTKAVVTDFGLARPEVSEEGLVTLSETGAISGTPAYMAPEQVEGRRLTAAADIYAFGIVLYEMATGRRPFEGDSPMSIAIKRLTEKPVPPRVHFPALSETWNQTILRCLERDPAARFASATDVAQSLRGVEVPLSTTASITLTGRTPPKLRRRGAAAAIALAVVGTLAGVLWKSTESETPPVTTSQVAAAVPMRRAVAVMPLRNNSGRADADWLSTAIADMIATELSAGGVVRAASGHDVTRLAADLGITSGRDLSAAERERLRQALGVDWLVTGSYTLIGREASSMLRLDVRLLNAVNGSTVRSHDATGSDRQLFDLVSRIGGVLRQPLGAGALSPADELQVQATLPADPEASRFYAEGIARLRAYDAKTAVERLQRAAKIDGKHPFIRHALSSAYAALGNEEAAAKESEQAMVLSGSLSREQKLLIEARLHVMRKELARAIEVERTLWEMFPDNVEYGVSLANSQIDAGRTNEALATVLELRKLPRPASLDPRIDLIESMAHQAAGNAAQQRASAQAAARKGRATGARVLLARARFLEAAALISLGDITSANDAIDEAQELFRAAGDESSVARAIALSASAVASQGDLESAQKLHEQSLAIFERVGNRNAAAHSLLSIGTMLISRGRSAEAKPLVDRSLDMLLGLGAKSAAAFALNDIGAILFYQGNLEGARERYMEAFRLFSELRDQSGQATALSNVGETLAYLGELDEARRVQMEALTMNRAVRSKAGEAFDLFRLGEIFASRGELAAARARYDEALKIQEQVDKTAAAETRVALARLALDEGHSPAQSEKTARTAGEILRSQGAAELAVASVAVVADALLAQGRQREALAAAEEAWKLAEGGEDPRVRYTVAVSVARARAASKKPADVDAALKFLDAQRAAAARSDFFSSELETRLALGEIEAAAGRPQGKKRLAALAAEAKAKGFQRIAARAAAGAA